MAKIDWLKVNKTLKYIQNIAYLPALPTANEDSADFVSVNNVLYAKQVNNGVYSYAEVGGGGSAEPIIKTLEQTDTGMLITFTEAELAQIQNNLGTVVKLDMGGAYLPLSPSYSRMDMEAMQPKLILCCELVGMGVWYRFEPTDNPLIFAFNQSDMSNPFSGGGNATDTAYQFISVNLSEYDTEYGEFIPIGTSLGVLDGGSAPDSRKIVLCEGDIEEIKTLMQFYGLSAPIVEDDMSIADFKCATTITLNPQEYMTVPLVVVNEFVNDSEELADLIKNGTYSINPTGYKVDRTDITIFTYKGIYGGLEYTLEARPLYQKLSSSNSYTKANLYVLVVANVGKGTTYIQLNDISSVEDCVNILNGDYTSVRYRTNNDLFGNIVYKTRNTYVCELFGDFTGSDTTGYVGVLKTYVSCTYDKTNNTVGYNYYNNWSSSVIANPTSGTTNNATSGGTLTQLLVNDKVYDIPSGGEQETIDVSTWFTSQTATGVSGTVPQEYRDMSRLTKALLIGILNGHTYIFRYVENLDEGEFAFISIKVEQGLLCYDLYIRTFDWHISINVLNVNEVRVLNLNDYSPSTATSGTLEHNDVYYLQQNDQNYIVFNNEIFKLADKQHNEGYLVYSHNGHDTTGCFFQKCITITISTRGWVLEEQENASKTYVSEQITTAYGFDVSVDGETLVFDTIGNVLQGDY